MKQASLFGEPSYPPMVVWVRAPHFKAGLAFDRQTGEVTEAAPILEWAKGKSWGYCAGYFARKGYEVVMWIDGHHPSQGGQYIVESGRGEEAQKHGEQGGAHRDEDAGGDVPLPAD